MLTDGVDVNQLHCLTSKLNGKCEKIKLYMENLKTSIKVVFNVSSYLESSVMMRCPQHCVFFKSHLISASGILNVDIIIHT